MSDDFAALKRAIQDGWESVLTDSSWISEEEMLELLGISAEKLVEDREAVHLSENVVQSIVECDKRQATIKLVAQLAKGIESIRNQGALSAEEAFAGLEEKELN